MDESKDHLVAARDSETGELWTKANEEWQEEHFEYVERFMRGEQLKGVCEYPPNGHELCDTRCATCEYCHTSYREPRLSRMRHISELLDEALLDIAEMQKS